MLYYLWINIDASFNESSVRLDQATMVLHLDPLPFYMLRFICEGEGYKPQHIEWERGNGSSWLD